MKKLIYTALISLIITVTAQTSIYAQEITFKIGKSQYTQDGKTITMDGIPFIEKGRTYLPVKYLAQAVGLKAKWEPKQQKVTLYDNTNKLTMKIGSKELTINGKTKQMDVPPLLKKGRTYLPARWIAEAVSYTIQPKDGGVLIYKKEEEKTEPISMNMKHEDMTGIQGTELIDVVELLKQIGVEEIKFDGKILTAIANDKSKKISIEEGRAEIRIDFGTGSEQSFKMAAEPKVTEGKLGITQDCIPIIGMFASYLTNQKGDMKNEN